MNDYDRRQLELMLLQIAAYESGKIDLNGLVRNLEALRYLLQAIPESWLEKFWSEWSTLEMVYSVAIVREQHIESPTNRAEIDPAIGRIKEMVIELLNSNNDQGS